MGVGNNARSLPAVLFLTSIPFGQVVVRWDIPRSSSTWYALSLFKVLPLRAHILTALHPSTGQARSEALRVRLRALFPDVILTFELTLHLSGYVHYNSYWYAILTYISKSPVSD